MRRIIIAFAAVAAVSLSTAAWAQDPTATASGTGNPFINYQRNVGGDFGNPNANPAGPGRFENTYTFQIDFARTATVDITSLMSPRQGGTCAEGEPDDTSGCDFSTNVNFVSNGVRIEGVVIPVFSSGVNERRYLANFRIPQNIALTDFPIVNTILVRGSAGANGSYLGSLVLSSVPEPSTWALMIAGFGAIGGAMRRRSHIRRSRAALG